MCRLLGYFGAPIQLGQILAEPKHSLIVQSYQPQEMTAGLLNADGFGIGWYHVDRSNQIYQSNQAGQSGQAGQLDRLERSDSNQLAIEPFRYRNTLPIWSDVNLPHLNRYVKSDCILANVRSATPGLAVDLANCQPFCFGQITAIHNGYIENFRQSLYRPIRDHLDDEFYTSIDGHTDSEHIFALLLNNLKRTEADLTQAVEKTLMQVLAWAKQSSVSASLNMVIGDGDKLVACRSATNSPAPSLYWLKDSDRFPGAVIVASEPMFDDFGWATFPEHSILTVQANLDLDVYLY
ncbi:hypothetical protein Pse7367_0227 [Thalassoporum mexicanum PCC 7367]|uniref:ergothioneine biosynthesis protein EgtC n=1 Tax=Thalassoporum mexicanum TaxID=3457544 RepID=UPI00029FCFF1|nr:ergothioneine biosynthesis protein EgtC [Pseudanabaena sp. PCC 7367]AFY68544.1 hypothetical protein Pse7367_0227 [Pseudanabaena sp. PCC 7367]